MGLREFFDSFEDGVDLHGSFTLDWSMKGCGFGQYQFYNDEDGNIHIANECMSREYIKRVLNCMVDSAILDDELLQQPTNKGEENG